MPFLTIAFPVFDPIAISIGPIAIRWYALAYIGGIVLGWIYARACSRTSGCGAGRRRSRCCSSTTSSSGSRSASSSAAAPATCCSTICRSSSQHPGRDFRIVEGRHVVPRRLPRLRRRGDPVLPQEQHVDPVARRHHHRGRADRRCSSGGSPISSMANCGAGRPTRPALGDGLSRPAARCRAIRASSTRLAWRDPAVYAARGDDPDGRVETAGPDPRKLHRISTGLRVSSASISASPIPSSDFCGAG